ncbi:hypothetical protein Hypma_011738 [Hypsizygus marmoreus]|uniref:Charged multivesicular body protein 7 n=1 Tax=Hypsizygus marmoreus TaxID=39966 RepID=A0A369JIL2_HYPMA|nr:hypothetical protein Hypma_011738 [Hypsizygus marmoreus]
MPVQLGDLFVIISLRKLSAGDIFIVRIVKLRLQSQRLTLDRWPRWSVNCSTVYFNVFPMDIPPDTEVPAWAYILDPGMDSIFNVTAARIMATNTSTPETENAIGASTAKHSVSAATAGLIGAISTLGVIICVAVVYFIWSRRFRRKSGPVQQSSYSPLYETHREASPFMVLRAHSVDGGRTTPHKVPLSSLRTSSPHRLDMTANNSLVSLPNNLYIPKHSNPTSYQSTIEWWRKAFESIVRSGFQADSESRLSLNAGRSLMERVRVEGVGKPLALRAVIVRFICFWKTELQASKSLISRQDFLNAKDSIYDPGWLPARIAAFVVGKPLWWALEQLGIVGEDGILGGSHSGSRHHKDTTWWGEYVVVPLVEKAADETLAKQEGKVGGSGDRLYTFEDFRKQFGSVVGVTTLTEGDAKVLLRYLQRDRKAILFDEEIVKFIMDDPSTPREINAADKGILELRSAVQNLHAQVNGLHHKMDECTRKATDALRQKRKPVALSHLRLKKQLEDLLSKRLGSLSTLESTLIRVEAAAGDIEIMKSYESSTATLRAILAHPSLQRESIEATMDALAEVNADAREVNEAVRIGADVAVGVEEVIDEGDLEDELRALVREAEAEKQAAESAKESVEIETRLVGAGMQVPEGVPSAEKVRVPAS